MIGALALCAYGRLVVADAGVLPLWVADRVVIESGVDLRVTGKLTPKRLPEEGAVSAGRCRYSVMDAAVTAWISSAEWAISTLRGFASSATGMVRVRTPLS